MGHSSGEAKDGEVSAPPPEVEALVARTGVELAEVRGAVRAPPLLAHRPSPGDGEAPEACCGPEGCEPCGCPPREA